jgi:acylphosphatase
VENLRDGSVGIICEGEEEIIDTFVKQIKIKKDFIDIYQGDA